VTVSAYIHPTAEVSPQSSIGEGTSIWNWTKVREGAEIGVNVNIGQCVYIDFNTEVGDRTKIQNGVSLYHGVTIGSDVFVGPNVTFTNDLIPRAHNNDWVVSKTNVEDGASIGANATIVCGINLGRHCMVAAGAVVTKNVPAHALVAGCPARIVDYVTITGKRLCVEDVTSPPESHQLDDKEVG